ncbi:YidB family protein [Mesorhizobium sp. KR1-2]|uniref:YidB family protein n=1 Tax=Mesorhizobium sp. KR1-2 TaxID=3156609 RepID=UPI0032B4C8B2
MGLFDDAVPGGNIGKPLMIALGALLVGKMLSGKSQPQQGEPAQSGEGGLLGGLQGLLEKLRDSGQGAAADSWVGTGQNKPIAPEDLGRAIGPQTIKAIADRAGMSEDELLRQLSMALPGVIDKLTPDGNVPRPDQIASRWQE